MQQKELLPPNNALIASYAEKFKADERYYPADLALTKLIARFPSNEDLEDILLKVTSINRLYSTSVYDVNKMARHILSLRLDERLAKGDLLLIEAIARGHEIRSKKNYSEVYFYSFATKYCNWHNQKAYPIYDSFVEKLLCAYQKKDRFSDFTKDELRNYVAFNRVVGDFIKKYSLTECSNMKYLDKFLWKYGQEFFPKIVSS